MGEKDRVMDQNKTSPHFKNNDSEYLDQLKKNIGAESYKICVEQETEPPYVGEYDQHWIKGTYHCKVCGAKLFSSDDKYDAACGWPAFSKPDKDAVNIEYKPDNSISPFSGKLRTLEIICKVCGSHLGHSMGDGPKEF